MQLDAQAVLTPTETQPETTASSRPISRRSFLLGSGAAATLALYSGEVARHEIQITERTLNIPALADAFSGFRIAQLSDIHLDQYTEPGFLERVLRHTNALKPDLVLITGDYICKGPLSDAFAIRSAGRCGELLQQLTCPLRYGSLGNHDVHVSRTEVAGHLRATGLPILINQYVPVERGGKRIWIGGLDDPSQGAPNLDLAVPDRPDGPVILLAHEPDYADEIAKHPRSRFVDVILSGHSHGGQVRLPGIRPLALPPMAEIYYEGMYKVGKMQLYVNRGIGTVGVPFRLFCPPEITLFKLQPGVLPDGPTARGAVTS